MQKLPDFVAAFSHLLEPPMRDGSQFTCMLFHPSIDRGIPLHSAVESQQVRSLHCSTFSFEICGYLALFTRRLRGLSCPEPALCLPRRRFAFCWAYLGMIAFDFANGSDLRGSHATHVNVQPKDVNVGHPAAAKASYDANPGFR
jgi:hypothetical protein